MDYLVDIGVKRFPLAWYNKWIKIEVVLMLRSSPIFPPMASIIQ